MSSEQAKETIRANINIVDLIRTYVPLRKAGTVWKACCPFHNEKTPSFVVDPIRGTYHCFGCGEHGDIFTFLMKQAHLTFPEALRELAQRAGVTLEERRDPIDRARQARISRLYSIYEELASFYQRCITLKSAQIARDYLTSRNLPPDVINSFRLGYAPKRKNALLEWGRSHNYSVEELVAAQLLIPPRYAGENDYYDRFRGRLVFPIRDRRGRVCGFSARILDSSHPAKYINSPETEIFKKSHILYALPEAIPALARSPNHQAIVCEGQIDVIRCHSAGFTTAVASQGTAFTETHVELLKRSGASSVVIVFDGDGAGRKAALRTGKLFLAQDIPVTVANLPSGEDPDSLIRDKGAEGFQAILNQAESLVAFVVSTAKIQEKDPNSVDALARTANQILEILKVTPSAMMRERLKQEAAQLLNIPLDALSQDLQRLLEAEQQRSTPISSVSSKTEVLSSRETDTISDDFVDIDDSDLELLDDVGEAPLVSARPASRIPIELLDALAELILHHSNDTILLDEVRNCLPPHLIPSGPVRDLLASIHTNSPGTPLTIPQHDPDSTSYYDRLLLNDERLGGEMKPLDALIDLTRRFWIIATEQEREQLPPNDLQRLSLQNYINLLKNGPWEAVRPRLTDAEPVRMQNTAAEATPYAIEPVATPQPPTFKPTSAPRHSADLPDLPD